MPINPLARFRAKVIRKKMAKISGLRRWQPGSRPPPGMFWYLDGGTMLCVVSVVYEPDYDKQEESKKYAYVWIDDQMIAFADFGGNIFGPINIPNIKLSNRKCECDE